MGKLAATHENSPLIAAIEERSLATDDDWRKHEDFVVGVEVKAM